MSSQTIPLDNKSFQQMNLAANLLNALEKMNILNPTEIQRDSIPIILSGADLIAIAQTGSGKTLAFALPIVTQLQTNKDNRALILAPSREVAEQIYKVFLKLLDGTSILPGLIIGGIPNKEQVSLLKKKPRLLVATPGRMNDHLVNNKLLLQNVGLVVIDEADRMLDLGFSPQLKSIRKTMRGTWQTMMFSASFSDDVHAVAKSFMGGEPTIIRANLAEKPVIDLKQKVFLIDEEHKNIQLIKELKVVKASVIIFVSDQSHSEKLGKYLEARGFSCDFTHGGLVPGHRKRVLREFREGKIQILITTDLLARGIDVEHVECVINFDLPFKAEDFLHRIGRTARAGRVGYAVTFVTQRDHEMYALIKEYLSGAEIIPLS
ncbi:MAG: DEAD/DEAH box helicase [Bdellovibrionales bacterium]